MAKEDKTEKAEIHAIAKLVGAAVGLSCVAATAKPSVEAEAIAAMEDAWVAVADKMIEFAEAGD